MKAYIFFLLLFLCSCEKYLDKKQDASLSVPTQLVDLQAQLDDIYTVNLRATPSLQESCADEHFILPSRLAGLSEKDQAAYIWNIGEYTLGSGWASAYTVVYKSNFCLEYLPEIAITTENQALWNNVKGSAHFLRAYYYLMLLWQHAKAYNPASAASDYGIVLRQGIDFTVPSVRASVADSYRQIIIDAHEALNYLPETASSIFRPSKIAALALLARTHLSMRNYDSAYVYANRCIDRKSELIDFNSVPVDRRNPFTQFSNPEFIFYTEGGPSEFPSHSPSRCFIDTILHSSYAIGDLRRRAFFLARSGYFIYKGGYTANPFGTFSGLATSEMFLIRAECHARAGRVNEAMNDLNHLLFHRWDASFTPLAAADANEALQIILEERKKEMLFRAVRWMDIKRLNAEGAGIVLQREMNGQMFELRPNDPRYAVKLASDLIEVTGMPQN